MGDIEERVKKLIREQMATYGAKVDVMPSDYTLEAAGFDSLDLVEATMSIEDEFGIEIDDNDMWKFTTVQSIVDYLTAKVAQ